MMVLPHLEGKEIALTRATAVHDLVAKLLCAAQL
jgi:hypothetical protein